MGVLSRRQTFSESRPQEHRFTAITDTKRPPLYIADLSPGSCGTVAGFAPGASPESISRFRSLGFVVGTAIEIERRLPFGGPIVVRLGGAAFAIEPDAARQVAILPGSQS